MLIQKIKFVSLVCLGLMLFFASCSKESINNEEIDEFEISAQDTSIDISSSNAKKSYNNNNKYPDIATKQKPTSGGYVKLTFSSSANRNSRKTQLYINNTSTDRNTDGLVASDKDEFYVHKVTIKNTFKNKDAHVAFYEKTGLNGGTSACKDVFIAQCSRNLYCQNCRGAQVKVPAGQTKTLTFDGRSRRSYTSGANFGGMRNDLIPSDNDKNSSIVNSYRVVLVNK